MAVFLLTFLLVAGAALAQPAVTERDIDYAGAGRPDQILDLDVPEGPGPFPLLIHVHGGGWRSGEKGRGAGAVLVRPRMGARGYAFASINYRLSDAASIFGEGLTDSTATTPSAELPTTLADLSVEIEDSNGTGHEAGLYFASPSQVNFQMPLETASGRTLVRLRRGNDEVLSEWVQVNPSAPALFSADGTGAHWAAGQVVYSNGSTFPLADSSGPVAINLSAHPAPAVLVLYGTGLGQTAQPQVIAWIGDLEAALAYAGPQGRYPGLDQFNIEIPQALAGRGDLSVLISAAGVPSNPVRVQVE